MNPLLVKNVNNESTYYGDADSSLYGTLSAVDQSPSILGIDWDGLPDLLEVKKMGYEFLLGPETMEKATNQYGGTGSLYKKLSVCYMSLFPVYFANGFVGWNLTHSWNGLLSGNVAIWRRAYNVNTSHGMSPLGRYTSIRTWDTLSQSPSSTTLADYLITYGNSLKIVIP